MKPRVIQYTSDLARKIDRKKEYKSNKLLNSVGGKLEQL